MTPTQKFQRHEPTIRMDSTAAPGGWRERTHRPLCYQAGAADYHHDGFGPGSASRSASHGAVAQLHHGSAERSGGR